MTEQSKTTRVPSAITAHQDASPPPPGRQNALPDARKLDPRRPAGLPPSLEDSLCTRGPLPPPEGLSSAQPGNHPGMVSAPAPRRRRVADLIDLDDALFEFLFESADLSASENGELVANTSSWILALTPTASEEGRLEMETDPDQMPGQDDPQGGGPGGDSPETPDNENPASEERPQGGRNLSGGSMPQGT